MYMDIDQLLVEATGNLRRGAVAEAEHLYTLVLNMAPNTTAALHGIATLAFHRGDYAKAEECLLNASRVDPESTQYLLDLGRVYQRLELCAAAVECYRRVLDMDPRNVSACARLADSLKGLGDCSAAIRFYDKALELYPDRSVARAKARAMALAGDLTGAIELQTRLRRCRLRRLDSVRRATAAIRNQRTDAVNSQQCTLGVIAGDAFARSDGVKVYLHSLSCVNADKHVIVCNISADTERLIGKYGCTVTRVDEPERLTRDRWLLYYEFLLATGYKRCILTDTKDVLFQRDPFEIAVEPGAVILVGEAATHGTLFWNLDQQMGLQTSTGAAADCAEWEVINAGVIYGDAERVKELCLLMYSNLMLSDPDSSDQAMLNFLFHNLLATHPGYSVQRHTSAAFCAMGGAMRTRPDTAGSDIIWIGSKICHLRHGVYAMVHQWERTGFSEHILKGVH
jgi:tetratricopeptide (TPR) repeat protein